MRYLGVPVGHSSLRAQVVPKKPTEPPAQLPLFDEADEPTSSAKGAAKKTAEPSPGSAEARVAEARTAEAINAKIVPRGAVT